MTALEPLVSVSTIIIGLAMLWIIFQFARAVRAFLPFIYPVLYFIPIPFLPIVGILILNGKATRILQGQGLRVRFLGVSPQDLERHLQAEVQPVAR